MLLSAQSPALACKASGASSSTRLLSALPCPSPAVRHQSGVISHTTHSPRRAVAASVIIKSRTEREDNDIEKVLVCQDQIDLILDDLGRQIGRDYENKPLFVLGVLKGGFIFTADLIRHIHPVPPVMEVDFFRAASYGLGIHSSGKVTLDDTFDLSKIKDKHVLVCEDIIDTGLTMSSIVSLLRSAGAMSVRVCVLLDKRTRRKQTSDADYIGMVCPSDFVVGYGIDFAERYRWLPYIGVPKPEVVEAILADNAKREAEKKAKVEALVKIEEEANARRLSNGNGNGHASNVVMNGMKTAATPANGNGNGVLIAKPAVRK